MKTAEIRQRFLQYFADHGHTIVPSSPLIPANDATLLFTNAGMVQFKETFLGLEKRKYTRATSSQRCVRAGGKHNDLENVGYTARHHTFFEMLGNFSFGDYDKTQAIEFAWNFLTEVLGLPAEKLWVTVFEDDKEAEDIWLNHMKVDIKRFSRCGEKDNFWAMGDTGPCGPCTEIFYDHGEEIPGGPPGSPDEDADRYIEIWNVVFMQYERAADGTLTELPKLSVDTGMGLERIAAVMQGVHTNYDIDLFQHLIKAAAEVVGCEDLTSPSLKVIADHIRACAFLIVDGVLPSNEGRGYVLRRIIRRAARHGHNLGQPKPFFYQLVDTLCEEMGAAYPELMEKKKTIKKALLQEEEQFAKTLTQGMKIFEQAINALPNKRLPGDLIFQLYDTYGFPVDLTADVARERGYTLDMGGFDQAMQQQRSRSKEASQFGVDYTQQLKTDVSTEFTGYKDYEHTAVISGMYKGTDAMERLKKGEQGIIVLDRSPFYAESGGQVGDQGFIVSETGRFVVQDTKKQDKAHLHFGEVIEGELDIGMTVEVEIDLVRREAIKRNHSATHLLHAALKQLLGEQVNQKGSLVEASRLRFDFTYPQALTAEEIRSVEDLVNEKIRENLAVETEVMDIESAKQSGAVALFGEKYDENVRVLSMGGFSKELCGGTHTKRTGDIGLFKITTETSISAGVRRIVAVTGEGAVQWLHQLEDVIKSTAASLQAREDQLPERLTQLLTEQKKLQKELQRLQAKLSQQTSGDLAGDAIQMDGLQLLVQQVDVADVKALRQLLDQLKDKLGDCVVVLAWVQAPDKVHLIVGCSKTVADKVHAGELVNHLASQLGGKGGGRADMAQAGAKQADKLPEVLASVQSWVQEKL